MGPASTTGRPHSPGLRSAHRLAPGEPGHDRAVLYTDVSAPTTSCHSLNGSAARACSDGPPAWRARSLQAHGVAAAPPAHRNQDGSRGRAMRCKFASHRSGGSGGVPARLQGLCKFDGRRDRRLVRRARRCASGMPAPVVMVSPLLPDGEDAPVATSQLAHPLVQTDRARARRWSPSRSGGQCDHRSNAAVGERCRRDAAQASGAPRADQPDAGRRVRARFTHTPVGEQPALPTSEPVEGAEGPCPHLPTRRTRSTHVWTSG